MRRAAGALLAAALLAGCAGSPTEPSPTCSRCGAIGVLPPSSDAITTAVAVGRLQAGQTCVVGTVAVPRVEFVRCDFAVPNGIDSPGGKPHAVCAAGATFVDDGVIRISLADPANVLPLVTWEARNFYWMKSGCGQQAY